MRNDPLPENWRWQRLGSVVAEKETWQPHRQPRETLRYVDISAIDNIEGRIIEAKEIHGSTAPSRARKVIRAGDVLFGTTRPNLKNIAIVSDDLDGEICSTGFCVLRANPAAVIPSWLFHVARSNLIIDQVAPSQEKSAYPAVSDSEVLQSEIPLPHCVEEQQRIVDRIDELLQRATALRSNRVQAAAQLTRLVPALFKDVYEELLTEHRVVSLGDTGKLIGGGTPSKTNASFWNGDIPWIAPKYMKQWRLADSPDRITTDALSSTSAKLIPAPAVLFVVRGMILVRNVPIAIAESPLVINQDMRAIVPHGEISADFLACMMRGAEDALLRMVEVAGHGTRKLETERWSNLPIPMPPPSVQDAVVRRLNAVLERSQRLGSLHHQIDKAISCIAPSVLHRAFRGEL